MLGYYHTRLTNGILVDQGTQFEKREPFIYLAVRQNVQVEATETESHSSHGIGERYHNPLMNTYRKLRIGYPNADNSLLLQLSVKFMNDTMGPEGLVPSSIVFGEYLKVYKTSLTPISGPATEQRAVMLMTARAETQQKIENYRIQRALRHSVRADADRPYQPSDQVLI